MIMVLCGRCTLHFLVFHLVFALCKSIHKIFIVVVFLHSVFRNDSIKSKLKVGMNEKVKEIMKK